MVDRRTPLSTAATAVQIRFARSLGAGQTLVTILPPSRLNRDDTPAPPAGSTVEFVDQLRHSAEEFPAREPQVKG